MALPSYQNLIHHLIEGETPRVWSLLVTVFGDLAQEPGTRVSSALLGRITSDIGIKPEANRVALHRLRKEGWLDVERVGRNSYHRLTPWGLAQSVSASPRIYNQVPSPEKAWLIVQEKGGGHGEAERHTVWVAANAALTSRRPQSDDVFCTELRAETTLPGWMHDKICAPDLLALCKTVSDRFETFDQSLRHSNALTAMEITVLRILIVHSWRRIALRLPALPDHVFDPAWQIAASRARAAALLQKLPAADIAELEAMVSPAQSEARSA